MAEPVVRKPIDFGWVEVDFPGGPALDPTERLVWLSVHAPDPSFHRGGVHTAVPLPQTVVARAADPIGPSLVALAEAHPNWIAQVLVASPSGHWKSISPATTHEMAWTMGRLTHIQWLGTKGDTLVKTEGEEDNDREGLPDKLGPLVPMYELGVRIHGLENLHALKMPLTSNGVLGVGGAGAVVGGGVNSLSGIGVEGTTSSYGANYVDGGISGVSHLQRGISSHSFGLGPNEVMSMSRNRDGSNGKVNGWSLRRIRGAFSGECMVYVVISMASVSLIGALVTISTPVGLHSMHALFSGVVGQVFGFLF